MNQQLRPVLVIELLANSLISSSVKAHIVPHPSRQL